MILKLTINVCEHLSAAMLLFARVTRVSFPSIASLNMSCPVAESGFSSTKNTNDKIAKNVVYIVNQYDPISSPLFFKSVVMCTIFLEMLTQAAAQA